MNATLLIVEDEEGIRELLTDYLSSMDFTVYAAESGQRALELITEHQREVQLILSDNMMPGGMSGIDFLRETRKMGITTPALLFSAVMPKYRRSAKGSQYPPARIQTRRA